MPTLEERLRALEDWRFDASVDLGGLKGDVSKLKTAVRVLQNSALDLKDEADRVRRVNNRARRQQRKS